MTPTELVLENVLKIIMLLLMGMSLIGLIVPAFPGLIVIWVIILFHGLYFGFSTWGVVIFLLVSVLAVVGSLADNVMMSRSARRRGARWSSLAIAFVAGFVGSFFLTPIGGIAVTLAALFLAEYAVHKDPETAWKITKEMAIGWGWAFVIRLGFGIVMIGLWAIWAWA